MARIPIEIEKVKTFSSTSSLTGGRTITETVKYLFKISEKGQQWDRTFICGRNELLQLRNEIDKLISETTTAEVLQITPDKAAIVDEHYRKDSLCLGCSFQLTRKCPECLFVLQSPLERKLFLGLSKTFYSFRTQYALNWKGENISIEGKTFGDKTNNFKEVLTVVDFFMEKRQNKLCIYTDGHTYHERTEEQAQRDRNIDRKLQELGFTVLRYTGKEVNENVDKIITDIKKWIDR